MSELKRYFSRFGYLSSPDSDRWTDDFDGEFKSAVIACQKRLGLSVTGRLDSDTMSTTMSPRCGVWDDPPHGVDIHTTRCYAYFYCTLRWDRSAPVTLTYRFSCDHMIDYLSMSDVRAAFEYAFAHWAAIIPVSFEEVDETEGADIHIGFYHGNHRDRRWQSTWSQSRRTR
ncbi:hypothetical protein MLD38_023524 [Melastoma candidum]|uniref:Uncharacterized protein n=1 Tax=Melastoma candidum TaxID=119954 RepID=A0ACB9NR23_9MYRT|nr:hypothetical protein MLD38_023524 [Melastoma candidum]